MYVEFDNLVLNSKHIIAVELSEENNCLTVDTVGDTYELEFETKEDQLRAYENLKNALTDCD